MCRGALFADDADRVWRCASLHSVDVGRDRSVHLVPSGHGRAVVGDSAEMLAARRRFLAAGHYRALTAAVADAVVAGLAALPARDRRPAVVDLGCGEGSHLRGVLDVVDAAHGDVVAAGLDLSKDAVKLAAKLERRARFVVADSRERVPLADGSVDVGLVVFAPRGAAELARLIAAGGALVVAIPEADHLAGVRARWGGIGIHDEKRDRTVAELAGRFDVVDEAVVTADVGLDGAALADLLTMTPGRRHLDDDVIGAARAESGVADLRVRVLRFRRQ